MGKAYHKKLGVHKAATAGTGSGKGKATRGGNGKRAGGAGPRGGAKAVGGEDGGGWGGALTFSATEHSTFQTVSWQTYRSLTITRSSKAATTGEGMGKGAGGGNAKRSGGTKGVGATGPRVGTTGARRAGPGRAKGVGGAGGGGWGGAPTFSATGHSTFHTDATNEYYGCSSEHGVSVSPTGHSTFETDHITFDTAAETMNEYYDEEENLGLSMLEGGDEDDAEQHDTEFLCEQDGEGGEMGDDGSGWGGDDDNAGAGSGDDLFDGDYYDDGVAGGFDGGYNDDDGGDGADDWW